MLKKLLKYDLQAMFRFWWIAAAVTVILSVIGGYTWGMYQDLNRLPNIISGILKLIRFAAFFGIAALPIFSMVLVFIRFYKNFFSDEGYLTFTLPAKRQTLLNSKVISGFLSMLASAGVCATDLLIMASISTYPHAPLRGLLKDIGQLVTEWLESYQNFLPVYFLEFLTIGLLLLMLSVLFLYGCITFGSMIVKKGKLIASIGIYYGACNIFSSIAMLFLIFGIGSINIWVDTISVQQQNTLFALLYLGVIFFLAILCELLYSLQYWMLDKKLNLS